MEVAGPIPGPRRELSLLEARLRFVQLARMASLTRHVTIVTDAGRPIAAIVPAEPSHTARDGTRESATAGGWLRRIQHLRAQFHREHAVTIQALQQIWQEVDRLCPPGSDGGIDALRLAHASLRDPSA